MPGAVYTAILSLSGKQEQAIVGANVNDLFANHLIQLEHTVSNSTGGSAQVPAGGSYKDFGAALHGTRGTIRHGNASAATSLDIHMLPGSSITDSGFTLIGDVIEITSINPGDIYVLEMQYPPGPILPSELISQLRLVSRPGPSGPMDLAVAQNNPAVYPPNPVFSSFDNYMIGKVVPNLGDYGIDPATRTVWAVLNHNSQFAIAAIPEPASLALLSLPMIAMLRRRRPLV